MYLVQLRRMARCIIARQDLPACSRGWGPKRSRRTVQMRQGGGCALPCHLTADRLAPPHTEHAPLLLLAQAGPRAAAQHAVQQAAPPFSIFTHLKAAAQRRHPATKSSGGACSARCTRSGRSCRARERMQPRAVKRSLSAWRTDQCTQGKVQLQPAWLRSQLVWGRRALLFRPACKSEQAGTHILRPHCALTLTSASRLRLRGPVMVPSWCATATAMISSAQQGEAGQRSGG